MLRPPNGLITNHGHRGGIGISIQNLGKDQIKKEEEDVQVCIYASVCGSAP